MSGKPIYRVPSMKEIENLPWNGYNVVSTFSGGGGSCLGYRMAGYHVVWANEFVEEAQRTYRANHKDTYLNTLDIREVTPEMIFKESGLGKGEIDLFDGSPPCFAAGTLVKVEDGYKKIEDIQVGDRVLTHKGRYRRVVNVMSRDADNVCVLKVQGSEPITTTKNHPFFVRTMVRVGDKRTFTDPYWKSAEELEIVKNSFNSIRRQDYVGLPINKEANLPEWNGVETNHIVHGRTVLVEKKNKLDMSSVDFWYFVGRYIGDGWRRKDRKAVLICDGKDKKEELLQVIERAGFHPCVTEQRTSYRFEISNIELWTFLSQFKDGAENKYLPEFVLDLPKNLLEAFVRGYLSADGGFDRRYKKWRVNTVSQALAYGLEACVAKVFEQPCGFHTREKNTDTIEGRKINYRKAYEVQFFDEKRKQQHFFCDGNYIWVPFRGRDEAGGCKVYNMSVEEDESYTVYNIVVHNCSAFSTAGKRDKGWGKQKTYSDGKTQRVDDLFFEFTRLLEGLQPKTFIAENVSGLTMGKAKGYFKEILQELRRCGYVAEARLVCAEYLGVPQSRHRIIFQGVRQDLAEKYNLKPNYPKPFGYMYTLADAFDGVENSEEEIKRLEAVAEAHGWGKVLKKMKKNPVKPESGAKYMNGSYFNLKRESLNAPCSTICQNSGEEGRSGNCHPIEDRKFSIPELKRITSIPDDFILTGSYSQKWERLGRMVPPIMMMHISEAVKEGVLDKI